VVGSPGAETRSAAGGRRFRACVLDFDGVIADTEPIHAEAKRRTLDRYGIAYPPTIFDAFKGRTDVDFFDYVAAELGPTGHRSSVLLEAKRREYLTLFEDVQLMPGFTAFLPLARRRFERIGIATSATRHDFELVAKRFDFISSIDAVVTSDDTTRFKPDPEPYLVALERLRVEADAALVVEDSPNGVRSAVAAGTFVVGLATAFPRSELEAAGADLVLGGFGELSGRLDAILAGA
jgi:beta-phosphoglucomutase